ncbi:Gfo/Idh/MocA family oxidoreductase [Leifsonia sp. ZF2019]|uniref:Gfo/Idh/MocA family protein n=1 Tax=Leifsonia sp. ZF2019 TaxID=2781978 RepID=UPI001CBFFDE6|nr:Gfo/Idh/MocA family oxidoreductase [Leifsonia sp. ZF2019]UAJ78891.1 Gfo/Idh/MocA family oxidoreductase [Leifsonia sp. ZF2019]
MSGLSMGAMHPRVLIVGAGLRGRMFAHVVATEPQAELVGFVDPALPQGATAIIDGQPFPVWRSIADAYAEADPNSAIIATPDFLHADAVTELVNRGAALMLEKPVATTPEDTARIDDAVARAGVYCMVAFENRWNTPFLTIRQSVEAGQTGAPIFQAARLSNTYSVPQRMLSWAAKSSPLWFLMPHTVDLVQWIGGADIRTVFARGTRGVLAGRGIDTWDVVHVLAELTDGSTASLTSAWVLPESHPAPVDFTYELVGTQGSALTDIGRSGVQVFQDRHTTVGMLGGAFDGIDSGAPAWMTRRYLADLRSGRSPETPLAAGIQVNRVLFAVERSLRSGASEVVT